MARIHARSTGARLRRAVLTAAGLAGLAAVFAVALPRQPEIAGGRAAEAVIAPATGSSPAGATAPVPPDAGSGKAATPPTGRAEPSGTLTRAAPETGLRRLPPRQLPKLAEAEPKEEIAEEPAPEAPRPALLPRPVAIDTATFLVGKARVELLGVQPVAPSRVCASGGKSWPCGMQARTALRGFLRARSIRCDVPEGFGQSGTSIESRCLLGKADIGGWLIANGWARAKPGGPYEADERTAREERRGIWGDGAAEVDPAMPDAEPAVVGSDDVATP